MDEKDLFTVLAQRLTALENRLIHLEEGLFLPRRRLVLRTEDGTLFESVLAAMIDTVPAVGDLYSRHVRSGILKTDKVLTGRVIARKIRQGHDGAEHIELILTEASFRE